ncbi:FAD/NAD(P)-binding domain-containing protein [Polyplosphaeria fusca]|uniref:FAD/NAD(P)-binding domain-containing protein n=1 Tax=Polyplosphaeria fusca TaxID=682080 RepID=A0A9P4V622_9PLEO|nr:FAD/NAD(P)-binding domain-containing protein [Polyplosphaeria fusca]
MQHHSHPLSFAIIGGGIGGLSTALSLRRAGHQTTIYERAHYAGEVGAAISCAANGLKYLQEWGVDLSIGRPVTLKRLIARDWHTGEIVNEVGFEDYEQKWGAPYLSFQRQDMHSMLLHAATDPEGDGTPATLFTDHKCTDVDLDTGHITFSNNTTANHDIVIGADGVGSTLRTLIGIAPHKRLSTSTCLHTNVPLSTLRTHALHTSSAATAADAIQFWGGTGINKIVLGPCRGGETLSYYCFFPRALLAASSDPSSSNHVQKHSVEELLAPYPDLDPQLRDQLRVSEDVSAWRLWVHDKYAYWTKGVVALMGDAAHPMMPDQSQGACQAIEDAAALGIVFGGEMFGGDVRRAWELYEGLRMGRAGRVQDAALRAQENISERVGFTDTTTNQMYRVAGEEEKLTIQELNAYDMRRDARAKIESMDSLKR